MVGPVVNCQACWREADRVSFCVVCRLTLCTICRGAHPVACEGCRRSSLRGRRGVVALARRSTDLLDEAAREAEGLAGRVAEHASRQWLAATDDYRGQFLDALESDLLLLAAKGDAADRAGAFAAASLPQRSRRRADEVAASASRFHQARDGARAAIDGLIPQGAASPLAVRARDFRRKLIGVLALVVLAIGVLPVIERLISTP